MVKSSILRESPAIEGSTASNSLISFCSAARLAAVAAIAAFTAATRAASIAATRAASLASAEESVVVAEREPDALLKPTLFLALTVTEYEVLPLIPEVIVKGDVVVAADTYVPPLSEYS